MDYLKAVTPPYGRIAPVRLDTHWWIAKAELHKPLDELRRQFTCRSRYPNGPCVAAFAESDDAFGIPRYALDPGKMQTLSSKIHDCTAPGSPAPFTFTSTLRPRQAPLVHNFTRALDAGRSGFLLHAPTGTGKTVMLLKMLEHLGITALVLVPRVAIIDQWRERILQHTDIPAESIGLAQRETCDFEGKTIVLGMIHSVATGRYPEAFLRWPGVVVWDEVHVTGSEFFARTIAMFPARLRLGASATLRRRDGLDEVYRMAVGETLLSMPGPTEVAPLVRLTPFASTRKPPPHLHRLHDVTRRRGVIISHLARDPARNALIAASAHDLCASGRRVLVLSDRKAQLRSLAKLLVRVHRLPPESVGLFVQETPKAERERILAESSIILATYGVMAMAIDVPDLRGLVFGTPLSDVEQPLGRILRRCESALDPIVCDIVDTAFAETRRWAETRERFYTGRACARVEGLGQESMD